jgi:hypothetical protein
VQRKDSNDEVVDDDETAVYEGVGWFGSSSWSKGTGKSVTATFDKEVRTDARRSEKNHFAG